MIVGNAIGQTLPLAVGVAISTVMFVLLLVIGVKVLGDGIGGLTG